MESPELGGKWVADLNYMEHTQDILHGFSTNIEVFFLEARNFCRPYGQKFLYERPEMTLDFPV